MTNTQPDTREQKLRDLRTIRDYLRDRRDELHEQKKTEDAWAIAREVLLLNEAITKAEAEAAE